MSDLITIQEKRIINKKKLRKKLDEGSLMVDWFFNGNETDDKRKL